MHQAVFFPHQPYLYVHACVGRVWPLTYQIHSTTTFVSGLLAAYSSP
jgi:hypothetical protein